MTPAIRLLAATALTVYAAGADAAGISIKMASAPIDIRPPAAVRQPVRALPPLPRMRSDAVSVASLRVSGAVSGEITGSISVEPAAVTPPAASTTGEASAPVSPPSAPVSPPPAVVSAAPQPSPAPAPAVPPSPTAAKAAPVVAVAAKKPTIPVASEAAPTEGVEADDPAALFTDRAQAVPTAPKTDRLPVAPPPAVAAAPVGEPYVLMRTLQSLQDEIAQGSTEALLAQRSIRARMDIDFVAAGASVWQDKRNAAAAVTYVLSGGAPAILKKMKSLTPPPAIDMNLLDGALAYVQGNQDEAERLLGGINAFDLLPSMGGQIALAQSALAVRTDSAKALRLLDVARLLAPGTLVEEAALRREIFVADQVGDGDKVLKLSRQYLERFRHSVYAGNFRNRFAAALSHMDLTKNPGQSQQIDDMLAAVEPAGRCQLFLTLALASVIKGNTVAAALAADRAASLAAPGSAEEVRAHLYRAAAGVGDAKTIDNAVADLKAVQKDALVASDQALYEVVEATVAGVASAADLPASSPTALDATDTELTPLFSRAADSLKAADAQLASVAK